MSVPEQIPTVSYTANGTTTNFPITFELSDERYLVVTKNMEIPPVGAYTVLNGNVIFGVAPNEGDIITLMRDTILDRENNYQNYDNSFRPEAVNYDLDKIWHVLQEQQLIDAQLLARVKEEIEWRRVNDNVLQHQIQILNDIMYGIFDNASQDYLNEKLKAITDAIDIAAAAGAGENGWTASLVVDASGQTQQQINENQRAINSRTVTPYDFGAIGDRLAHPLSERYATLAEAQVVYPSATSLTEYIDGHALNAWWRDICANDRKFATCHGQFVVNTKISNAGLNDHNNLIKTKHVDFAALILFNGVTEIIENGFEIISPRQMQFSGELEILDLQTTWANRKVNHLIYMEDLLHGKHTWKVVCRNARKLGLRVYSGASSISGVYTNNSTSDLGSWQFTGCGHRFSTQTFSFTSRSDTGAADNQGQRTVLTLSSPHGLGDLSDSFIRFNGRPYLVASSTENTLSIYPWLIETDATGTVEISTGGDFRLEGANSNQILMSSGSSGCAICSGKEGFYIGAKIQSTNEFNDIGFRLGNSISGIQVAGTYLGRYMEGNEFDIVGTSNTLNRTLIINPVAFDYNKCFFLAPLNSAREYSVAFQSAPTIIDVGKIVQTKRFQNTVGSTMSTNIKATVGDELFKLRASSPTVTLTDAPKMRELFGHTDVEFEIFGFASNNGTSGNTTIKCDTGYTINGIAGDLVIPSQNAPFKVSARLVNETDWRVYVFYAERPKGSKTHDWASLAAGAQQSTTVTVTGATLGNAAIATMDVALNGTSLRAEVTSANTVTVYQYNPTAAAVDVASGTITVKLI